MENVNPFDEDEYGAMHAFLELVIWCVALLVVICTVTVGVISPEFCPFLSINYELRIKSKLVVKQSKVEKQTTIDPMVGITLVIVFAAGVMTSQVFDHNIINYISYYQ